MRLVMEVKEKALEEIKKLKSFLTDLEYSIKNSKKKNIKWDDINITQLKLKKSYTTLNKSINKLE